MKDFRYLPNDILNIIFQNLSYDDYCRFICSSKYLYEASLNISYRLTLNIYNMGFIQNRFKSLKSFQNIPNFYFNEEVTLLNDVYSDYKHFEIKSYFEKSLENIESFTFDSLLKYETNSNLYVDFKKEGLIYLYVSNRMNLNIRKPRLSGILLEENTIINSVLCNSKNLYKLAIKEYVHANETTTMLHNLPNTLKILNVRGIVNINDNMLDIITQHTPNLLKFDISSSYVTDEGTSYLKRLTYLKNLNIAFNVKITDECFEHIGDIPSLRKLNISMCRLITDDGIETLVRKNNKLTHLNMEYVNIGQRSVNSMIEHLNEPIYINLDYTHYAEFLNISRLKQKCKVVTYKKI
jgi:hypothetical protein